MANYGTAVNQAVGEHFRGRRRDAHLERHDTNGHLLLLKLREALRHGAFGSEEAPHIRVAFPTSTTLGTDGFVGRLAGHALVPILAAPGDTRLTLGTIPKATHGDEPLVFVSNLPLPGAVKLAGKMFRHPSVPGETPYFTGEQYEPTVGWVTSGGTPQEVLVFKAGGSSQSRVRRFFPEEEIDARDSRGAREALAAGHLDEAALIKVMGFVGGARAGALLSLFRGAAEALPTSAQGVAGALRPWRRLMKERRALGQPYLLGEAMLEVARGAHQRWSDERPPEWAELQTGLLPLNPEVQRRMAESEAWFEQPRTAAEVVKHGRQVLAEAAARRGPAISPDDHAALERQRLAEETAKGAQAEADLAFAQEFLASRPRAGAAS